MTYPNLEAEISRFDYSIEDICAVLGKNSRTVRDWMDGKECGFPIPLAFKLKEEMFPDCSIDYLFSDEPMQIKEVTV